MTVAPVLPSWHCIGYDSQSRSRAVDVVLHGGRPAHPDRPDNFSVHLDGKPATPRRYTRQRGDAGQKRRVALDKVEKVLSGDAEQSGVRLLLRNLDGRHRGPIHPAKGLEIAAVIEDRHVLANAKFSGFCHCCIHHLLCELRRNAVFLHDVSHWSHSSLDMYCALVQCTSHSNDDLSELAVVLQIAMNFHHVVELECAIDDWLEWAALQAFEDKFHRTLSAGR